jgi:hypothetical protein
MAAIDTISTVIANPGASYTATVAASGDSLTVRNFPTTSPAYLEHMFRRGATKGSARVRSPRLHDNVTGINFATSETIDTLVIPNQLNQPLYPSDTLIAEMTGGGAETDGVALLIYYSQVQGITARLNTWADISGLVKSVKLFQTAVTNSATIGSWTDTLVTTTENQLHADSDYAVLGFKTDTVQTAVGIKGQETGNLRICGPGTTTGLDTSNWFVRWSAESNIAAIPVFNANNRFSVYVSTCDVAASTTPIITLICAELSAAAPN